MRRPLSNPVESLDGVEKAPRYREHGTKIESLVPNAEAVRKAVKR